MYIYIIGTDNRTTNLTYKENIMTNETLSLNKTQPGAAPKKAEKKQSLADKLYADYMSLSDDLRSDFDKKYKKRKDREEREALAKEKALYEQLKAKFGE